MTIEMAYATIPATWIKPGMHLSDARVPLDNRVDFVIEGLDGRTIVITRKRDHVPGRRSYTGSGHVVVYMPGKLAEVWERE